MWKAWRSVHRSALSGARDTKRKAVAFADKERQYIKTIQDQLRDGRYRFSPARPTPIKRINKKPRPVASPVIRDRIVQRALLEVISRQKSAKSVVDHPMSFGAIRKKGVNHAIERVCRGIHQGMSHYIRTDIRDFFTRLPRQDTLKILGDHLTDDSLNGILDMATKVELADADSLRDDILNMYPSVDIGVGQGFCLSPMLGNVFLNEFDRLMNRDESVVCIRYIDDLLILGQSLKDVWLSFRKASSYLEKKGMRVYHPRENQEKADDGSTARAFRFLGCSISPHFVRPHPERCESLVHKIDTVTKKSLQSFRQLKSTSYIHPDHSLAQVLREINKTVQAWGNHYSFCNSDQVFASLDGRISTILEGYIKAYRNFHVKADEANQRRLTGVHLLCDSKKESLYPLRHPSVSEP